jgi:LPXTG-motif cell wall-anchored protein
MRGWSLTSRARHRGSTRLLAAVVAFCLAGAGILVSAAPASAAGPTSVQVNTTSDVWPNFGVCGNSSASLGATVSLREALCYASVWGSVSPVTVSVPSGSYVLSNGALAIGTTAGSDITVTGAGGVTITGDGTHQVMTLDPAMVGGVIVRLSGLTIKNGVDNVYGGGGIIGGSANAALADELDISDSTFTGNSANSATPASTSNPGGAIQFIGGTLKISNSSFTGNTAGNSPGGAIAYQATGADADGEALDISGSVFSGNTTTAIQSLPNGGGAIVVDDIPGVTPLSVTGSTFTGNDSGSASNGRGSAIWLRGGSLSVLRSTFTGNTGASSVIAVSGGALTAQYNRMVGTSVDLAVIGGSADATDNWWGCSGAPNRTGCGSVTPATPSIYLPALTLNGSASPSLILPPVSFSTIRADLLTDSAGNAIAASDLTAFDGLPVLFSAPLPTGSSLSAASATLASGVASVQYLSGTGKGAGSVSVRLDSYPAVIVPVGIAFAPAISSVNTTTFTVGTAKSFAITSTGYPSSVLTGAGTLPAGVTFTGSAGGTATLSGTAAAGTGGDYPFTITATNAQGNVSQSFTLHVVQAPQISSAASTTFAAGAAGSFTVQATGSPTPDPITEAGTLPSGVTFTDNGDGTATIAGTPAAQSGGVYPLAISATNGIAPAGSQSFALTVTEPASFATGTSATFTTGAAASFPIQVYRGFPAPTVAITTTSTLPSGVTLLDNGDGTASLTGTPGAGSGGVYPVTLEATGSGVSLTQSVTLTVDEAPSVTLAAADQSVTSGNPVSFTSGVIGFPAPTVQWMVSTNGGILFSPLLLQTSPTLTFTAAQSQTGNLYRAVFTNASGSASSTAELTVGSSPTISSAASATFLVNGASQSFSLTTSGIPDAALGTTGTLPAWLQFVDNGDGSGTLSGIPPIGSHGQYSFTITAGNGFDPVASQAFALTVDEAATFSSGATATFTAGTSSSFLVTTDAGFPVATTLSETGSLPSGIRFTDSGNGTATIVGTPAAGTGGSYSIQIATANGSGLVNTLSFTLVVNETPAFTSSPAVNFVIGVPASFTVSTSGFPAAAIAQAGGTLPSGLSFTDNGDGTATINGTAAAGTAGDFTIALDASNVVTTANQDLTLHVLDAAAISSAASATFTAGTVGAFVISTTGRPTVSAISETGTLPHGVTLVDNGNGTATLSGTPAAGSGGAYPLTITATNGAGADASQSFVLTVDQAPSITSASVAAFTAGAPGTFTVRTGAAYPTAVSISVNGSLPASVTIIDNGDGTATIAGTPPIGAVGSYPITITASNGTLPNATQSLVLSVQSAPQITVGAAAQSVNAGNPASFTAAAVGFPAPTVRWQVSTNGGSTYTDLPGETAGTLDFMATQSENGNLYRAVFTNAAGTASSSAMLTVGTSPTISSTASASFTANGSVQQFAVTSSGIPSAIYTSAGTLPAWLQLIDNHDGSATLAGSPPAGSWGLYSFTIEASNGFGPAASQPFTLTVTDPAAFTTGAAATFGVGTAGTFAVTTRAGFPVATIISASGTLPAGVTFVDDGTGSATIAGTPAAGSGGSYPLTITAANGSNSASTQSFLLTVTEPVALTNADTTQFTRGVQGDFRFTTSHAFPSTVVLTLTGALPAGITFDDNHDGTATLQGVTLDAPATFPLTVIASNGTGTDAVQKFTLTVVAAAVVPLSLLGPPVGAASLTGVPGTVAPGQELIVSGDGFAGGSTVTFGIYSTAVVLGTTTASASGQVSMSITIPAGYTGQHSIVVAGIGADGAPLFLRSDVTVASPAATSAGTVAFTGPPEDVSLVVLIGLLLLVAGGIVLLRRRRSA